MTGRATTILLAGLLVTAGHAAALGIGPGEDPQRYIVDTETLGPEDLRDAAQAAGGHVVRIDEALAFAVVAVEEPGTFEEHAGVGLDSDPVLELFYETPAGEAATDTYLGLQWGPLELNGPQAWQVTDDQPSTTVAIVDSGIDLGHSDLPSGAIVEGHDYVEGDDSPNDENGHGTHVAGIVGATRDNDRGVAGMAQAELLVIRTHNANGLGYCSDVASAIQDAVEAGADVINLSLGGGHCGAMADAVASAYQQGVVVVAAAGNSQQSAPDKCVRHPAAHSEAIAVAATDPTLQAADYSCRGSAVELSAPGSAVLSTVPGSAYGLKWGTSMAAPHVSATAALLVETAPSLSPTEIRQTLRDTARDLGERGQDEAHGHGMVDPVEALTGLPVFVSTDLAVIEQEYEGPTGNTCASATGAADCRWIALAGTGEARTGSNGLATASGTEDATACEVFVGDGNTQIFPTCVAASGTGDATGSPLAVTLTGDARADCVAVSATGQATSDCQAFGLETEVSACESVQQSTGSSGACLDPN